VKNVNPSMGAFDVSAEADVRSKILRALRGGTDYVLPSFSLVDKWMSFIMFLVGFIVFVLIFVCVCSVVYKYKQLKRNSRGSDCKHHCQATQSCE